MRRWFEVPSNVSVVSSLIAVSRFSALRVRLRGLCRPGLLEESAPVKLSLDLRRPARRCPESSPFSLSFDLRRFTRWMEVPMVSTPLPLSLLLLRRAEGSSDWTLRSFAREDVLRRGGSGGGGVLGESSFGFRRKPGVAPGDLVKSLAILPTPGDDPGDLV
jgi:hypothetical protein